MSEPAAASHPQLESFTEAWSKALSQVLGEIAGTPFAASVSPEASTEVSASSAADLWIVAACSGGLRGEMSLRIPPPSIVRLAQTFMSEPANPAAEVTAEHREAVLELLRQAGGLVATSIASVWGEVQIRLEAADTAPSWAAASTAWLREDSSPLWIEIQLSAALVAGLRTERSDTVPASAPSAAEAATPSLASSPPQPASPSPGRSAVNLDLLMDVELGVTLRFGSRRMLLRDILDLNAGAVITLDRQVPEPVDMLLDGRIVARGEIVVIDGTYGLRITEVGPAGVS